MDQSEIVDKIIEGLPVYVRRGDVGRLTGGLISGRTLANEDCVGTGPQGRVMIGRTICYPREELGRWLRGKVRLPHRQGPRESRLKSQPQKQEG